MTQSDQDLARIRSLIFESVSRTEKFEHLLDEVDALSGGEEGDPLTALAPDFLDASTTAGQAAAAGQGANDLRFSFNRKGRILGGTAPAISLFGLLPGESFKAQLGESGQTVLDDLLRGRRSQAMFTLFSNPRRRPVPVMAQVAENDSFDAFAITVHWNGAIATLLRDGFSLTDAEVDVVELLFQGNSPKDIARHRDRSPETVRTQLRTICRKTDTHGHGDVVHLVYGLIATASHLQAEHRAQLHGNYMLKLPSGRTLDVETTGSARGKPLLFLHGCLGGRRLPGQALQALSDRYIIAPGRPGHGQTQLGQGLGPKETARDILHVLDHFNVPATDVLSYDLGLPSALWLAALAPDRVTRVLALAPVPPLVRWKELSGITTETRVFSVLSRVNTSAARYLALLGGQRILRQGPEGFAKIVFNGAKQDQALIARDPEIQRLFWHGHAWHVERGPDGFLADAALSSFPWDEELPDLSTPVSFILGDSDRNVPQAATSRLSAQLNAPIQVLPHAGHGLLHTHPDAWLDALLAT